MGNTGSVQGSFPLLQRSQWTPGISLQQTTVQNGQEWKVDIRNEAEKYALNWHNQFLPSSNGWLTVLAVGPLCSTA